MAPPPRHGLDDIVHVHQRATTTDPAGLMDATAAVRTGRIAVIGLAAMLVNLFGVNIFTSSFHSNSGVKS